MKSGRRIDTTKTSTPAPNKNGPLSHLDQSDQIWMEGVKVVVRKRIEEVHAELPERSQERSFLVWVLSNDLNLIHAYALQHAKARKAAIARVRSGASASAAESDPAAESDTDASS